MNIEFFDVDDVNQETLGGGDWPCIPLVGETMIIGSFIYVVESREWSTGGDGTPLWNQPFCAVNLKRSPLPH